MCRKGRARPGSAENCWSFSSRGVFALFALHVSGTQGRLRHKKAALGMSPCGLHTRLPVSRFRPLVNITAYKKADGTWGGSSSSEPYDAIVRTKSVYGNARQRYGVNRPRRTRRTSSNSDHPDAYPWATRPVPVIGSIGFGLPGDERALDSQPPEGLA